MLKYRPIPTRIAGEEAFFKNHDVTIMTSSDHVTSSGACPIDSPWALYYRLSIGTIPLSGLVSEIFSPKIAVRQTSWQTDTKVILMVAKGERSRTTGLTPGQTHGSRQARTHGWTNRKHNAFDTPIGGRKNKQEIF